MIKIIKISTIFVLSSLLLACNPAEVTSTSTSTPEAFFKGKTLTYVVATKAGGGYDAYGRLVAKYMGKSLGATIIVKNMPGAGHIIGANYIYNAKKDGTVFGSFNTGLIHAQLIERDGVKFDLNKMSWLGKAAGDTRVIMLGEKSKFKTFEDILNAKEPVKFGTAGIGSASTSDVMLLIEALDINGKLLPGFNGNEGEMSMMRGEIDGTLGSYASLRAFSEFGNGVFVAQIGEVIDNIPKAIDYAEDDDARSVINLIGSLAQLGRLTAAPPGMAPERLKVLRDAYRAALTNPDFLAEAKKQKMPIAPLFGDDVGDKISQSLNQSPQMLAKIKTILGKKADVTSVTTRLTGIVDGGRFILFEDNGNIIKSKVSGSRTKLTIAAKTEDRSNLRTGMSCKIKYVPGGKNEPKELFCN